MFENNEPEVDILFPCFNSARYLADAVESVLSQDYSRVTLFVQDGGSTDGSLDVLRRYPIQWASAADNGISQALNRAIGATRGDIIGFTAADDLLRPGAVSAAVEVFQERPETVMVYGDCDMADREGRVFRLWKSRPFDFDELFWACYIPWQTVYIRRQALAEVGEFDESLDTGQDWDMWIRLGTRFPAERFEYIARGQGCYRWYPGSATWRNLKNTAGSPTQKVLSSFFDNPAKVAQLGKGRNRALAGTLLGMAQGYALAGERGVAITTYARAARTYPQLVLTKTGILVAATCVMGYRLWRKCQEIKVARGLAKMSSSGEHGSAEKVG